MPVWPRLLRCSATKRGRANNCRRSNIKPVADTFRRTCSPWFTAGSVISNRHLRGYTAVPANQTSILFAQRSIPHSGRSMRRHAGPNCVLKPGCHCCRCRNCQTPAIRGQAGVRPSRNRVGALSVNGARSAGDHWPAAARAMRCSADARFCATQSCVPAASTRASASSMIALR